MSHYLRPISVATLTACSLVSPFRAWGQHAVPPTEIVLVGTIHARHVLQPDYSPAHLRALLAKIRPDLLAIENPPDWQSAGRYFWALLPEYYVAAGYAKERSIPVVGVDGGAPGDSIACPWTDEVRASLHQRDVLRGIGEADAHLAFGEWPVGVEASQRKFRWEDLDANDRETAQDSANFPREDHIASNILKVAAANPGKRIAVLFGSAHLFTLYTRLHTLPSVRLVPSTSFLPLTPAELNTAARTSDLAILLAANLESLPALAAPQTRNQQRSRELLTRLLHEDPSGFAGPYYEAWWHWTMGRRTEAGALFDRVIVGATSDSVAWVGTPRWGAWPSWKRFHDKALFARAALYDIQGQHTQAVGIYQRLLDSLPPSALRTSPGSPNEYYDVAGYLRLLIAEGFRGGETETARSIDFHFCGAPGKP